ncbi:hypothetical protein K2173_003077 [Erythroxylum novogranatense]|uniref:Uncharacterized protein n=1 Tax=Erythroxylum novogranatense TaxID=1862640 RepID=A0AAV8TBQ0_9ROSI|nr:hypothetical protein K2173_003077 [Erythroxylum novogranatense]
MVPKLEAIKGGGGSIRVGTTGTISSLMTKELESMKSAPETPVSCHDKPRTTPVSISCSVSTPKSLQARKSLHEATSSGSSSLSHRGSETQRTSKSYIKNSHRTPILRSDYSTSDGTSTIERTNKKGTNFVEIVDIKCGNPDRAWASPLSNKLKKLGFSKLSDSIV